MADTNFYPSYQYGIGIKKAAFSFMGNGASSIDMTTLRGDAGQLVQSIDITGTGLYTITFKVPFRRLIGLIGYGQDNNYPAGLVYPLVASNEGTSTPLSVTLRATTATVATNIPDTAKIYMECVFQDDSAGTR